MSKIAKYDFKNFSSTYTGIDHHWSGPVCFEANLLMNNVGGKY